MAAQISLEVRDCGNEGHAGQGLAGLAPLIGAWTDRRMLLTPFRRMTPGRWHKLVGAASRQSRARRSQTLWSGGDQDSRRPILTVSASYTNPRTLNPSTAFPWNDSYHAGRVIL